MTAIGKNFANPVVVSDSATTTQTTQTADVKKTSEQKGDVFLRDGALSLPPSDKSASQQTLLGRAKKFLQTLRVASEGKLTFGGRLTLGGVDREASLRNYYPSLKVAKTLAEDDALVAGVLAFSKEISLPSDLADLAERATGALRAHPAQRALAAQEEAAKPLGTASDIPFTGRDGHHFKHLACGIPTPKGALEFSDAAIQKIFDSFYSTPFQTSWAERAVPDDKVGLLRLFARGKEIGANAQLQLNVLNSVDWPATDGAASAMRRLAKAFGFNEKDINFAGGTLDQFKASKTIPGPTVTSPRVEPKAGEMPSSPLGTKVIASAEAQKLIAARDPRVFLQDDAGLELLILKNTSMHNLAAQSRDHTDPKWWASLFTAWDRAEALGLDTSSQYSPGFVQTTLPVAALNDAPAMQALARLMKRGGFPPHFNTIDGKALTANAAFAKAWASLDKVAFGALAPIPERRAVEGIKAEPLATVTQAKSVWEVKLANKDVTYFDASDELIRRSDHVTRAYDVFAFHNYIASPRALLYISRLIELGSAGSKAKVSPWLTAGITAPFNADAYVPALLRLAAACEIPPSAVSFQMPSGTRITLDQHPTVPRPGTTAKGAAELTSQMASFDAASGASNEDRLGALEALLYNKGGIEVYEIVGAAKQALVDAKLEKIDFAKLSSAGREDAIAVVTADQHLGVSAVLAGLFLNGGDAELRAALESIGFEPTQASEWADFAGTLRSLDPKMTASVIADVAGEKPDFLLLPARIELAALKSLDAKSLEAAFAKHAALDPSGFTRAMIDRATVASTAEKTAVGDFIKQKVAEGKLENGDVLAALTGGRHAIILPNVDAEIDVAVSDVITADESKQSATIDVLKDVIKKNSAFVSPDELVATALGKLYQSDLATVIPLADADKQLGGVAAKAWSSDDKVAATSGKRIAISGIEIGVNEDPKKDVRAVPRKDSADMVMTETTERNLRLIAAEWRRARPVLLEGPTSAGKTSAIRYMSYVTGSPYRRINLSYHTDVSDLLGRYVGGESKYTLADLKKKDESDIDEIAEVYGIDPAESQAEKIKQIFDAQKNPRWVDGPIIKAMKRGEVLLLDEVNLARPEVIERLNSLFDDDGNLVLTEHRNEVIAPHDNFRVFATMNPASYAGRARMSEAMKSRWTGLFCHGLNQSDLTKILKAKYGGKVPDAELAKLIGAHDALARAADDGSIGRASGGVAFSLRNLFRVCDRFERYKGGALKDDALMRRESEEIYRGGLFEQEDIQAVNDILNTAMPYKGPGFYDAIDMEETATTLTIGDVTVAKLNTGHTFVPGESSRLILTKRTKEILYRLAKALDCGENVALIGERACGKTAMAKMYASLIGQPYYRQLISASTDTMQLVGGYDDRGWKDGLLLNAGRPENTPGMLLLDELNLGSSALLERLNPVLDDERKIVLAEKEGEEIRLHPDFRFVGAMNPPTKGYGGRQKLSKAMQNRLTQIYVPDLSKAEEQKEIMRAIAVKKGVPEAVADAIVDTHQWAQESYKYGTIGKSLRELDRPVHSVRQLLSALDMVSDFIAERGAGDAYMLAIETYYASTSEEADNKAILKKAEECAQ